MHPNKKQSTHKTYLCAHGTFASNKTSIKENGFIKNPGDFGKGVYFWVGSPEDYLIDLAKYWVNHGKKEKPNEKEEEGTVIMCDVIVPEEEVLDLASFEFFESYSKYLSVECKGGRGYSSEEMSDILEGYLHEMRAEDGFHYNYCITRQWLPDNESLSFPVELLGSPFCMVIKSKGALENLKKEDLRFVDFKLTK